jgi:pimeloyl-ACP methyl ester carboxylesterase
MVGELAQRGLTRRAFGLAMQRDNPKPLPPDFVDLMFSNLKHMGTHVLELYRSTDLGAFDVIGPALREMDPPTLVIWGRHDPYIAAEFAELQREFFPRAEVVVLEESGHWPFIDDPEGIARHVVPFLKRQVEG